MNKENWYPIASTDVPVGEVVRVAAMGGGELFFTVEIIIPTYDIQNRLRNGIVSIERLRSLCNYWRNPKHHSTMTNDFVLNYWQPVEDISKELNITVTL